METKACAKCGKTIPKGSYRGRCKECNKERDQNRGSTAQRGYGYAHQKRRAAIQDRVDAGEVVRCWKCGDRLLKSAWHLDHGPGRVRYRGPSCPPCHLSIAGKAAHKK